MSKETIKGKLVNRACITATKKHKELFTNLKGHTYSKTVVDERCSAQVYEDKEHPGFFVCGDGHEWGYL